MSNILSLPRYAASLGLDIYEDLDVSLTVLNSDGSALSLTGIAFEWMIGDGATLTTGPGGGLTISGAASNVLTAFLPAAAKAAWSGVYPMALLATDATPYNRAVFQNASLTVGFGLSSPLTLTPILSPASTIVSLANSQLVANTAAIAALQAQLGAAPTIVTTSPFAVPATGGWFLIDTPAATIELPAVTPGVTIILTDATMAEDPSHTIVGTINNDPTGGAINSPGGGMILGAVPALSSWWKQQ